MAERLATRCGQRVLVIDRRDHIAGNAYDYYDEHGVLVHQYGPHIFHTNSEKVVEYLSQLHRLASRTSTACWRSVDGKHAADPDQPHDDQRALRARAVAPTRRSSSSTPSAPSRSSYIRNSEDVVVAKVGRELYEKFFRGYTRKQWQRDPSELHASVCARIPIRTNTDDRYFTDTFQNMPADGYTAMFERILDHPGIEVRLEHRLLRRRATRSSTTTSSTPARSTRFFDHRFGALPYRSLEFELRNEPTPGRRAAAARRRQINEPERGRAVHAHDRVPAPDRPGRTTRSTLRGRVPAHRGRPVLPDPQRRDPRALQALRGARRRACRTSRSSAGSRATST